MIFNPGKIWGNEYFPSLLVETWIIPVFLNGHVVICMKSLKMCICSDLAIPLLEICSLKIYFREPKNMHRDLYKDFAADLLAKP